MPRRFRRATLAASVIGVVFAGPVAAQDGTPPVGNGDVGSGCWTPEQRASSAGTDGLQWSAPPNLVIDPARDYTATLRTNKGSIEVELFPEDAPQTVNNFVCLARAGYYDGTPFHRIVAGFVIQGGDPTGTGTGGPGYEFADETVVRDYERGTLAMANAGPDTNGSQFFIVLEDLRGRLPKDYTIFGRVIAGQEVVDAIAAVPTRVGPSGEPSEPTEPVILDEVTVIEVLSGGTPAARAEG